MCIHDQQVCPNYFGIVANGVPSSPKNALGDPIDVAGQFGGKLFDNIFYACLLLSSQLFLFEGGPSQTSVIININSNFGSANDIFLDPKAFATINAALMVSLV